MVPEDDALPADEDPRQTEELGSWKKAFDHMFVVSEKSASKIDPSATRSMLHVPIDMTLDICKEVPLDLMTLQADEEDERETLMREERYCIDHLCQAFSAGWSDANDVSITHQRTKLLRDMMGVYHGQLADVEEDEKVDRFAFQLAEEEERLVIVNQERASFNHHMDQDRTRIEAENASTINFRSRQSRLRDGTSRMIQRIGEDASLGPARSPSRPNRSRFTDVSAHPSTRHLDSVALNTTISQSATPQPIYLSDVPSANDQSSFERRSRDVQNALAELEDLQRQRAQHEDSFSFTGTAPDNSRRRSPWQ